MFLVVCLGVSNAFENLSILTGFPFGWYHYSDALGPKLFLVPVLIGPAYFGMGYLSWTLARAILGDDNSRLAGLRSFATPMIASFIMVSWDLTIDPMASTINGSWIWRDGGSYFGVPVSNFLGWYLTVYVFFQCFAVYARSQAGAYAINAGILGHAAAGIHVDQYCSHPKLNSTRRTYRRLDRSCRPPVADPRYSIG